ncbi:MAG TPA: ribosome assembly RNA-binding protein YhbY [Rhodocyclaceae bacterium]|nr:ribosome assembly RNA-binding protein YhbY [Rhodocyclaceae bacterium]
MIEKDLSPEQRRALRADAHHLKPVASLGQQGLTDAVLKEIDLALKSHALIKVKLHGIERDDRDALFGQICEALDCAPVQHIGNILVLWREKPEEPETAKKPTTRRAPKPLNKKQAAAATERRRRTTR